MFDLVVNRFPSTREIQTYHPRKLYFVPGTRHQAVVDLDIIREGRARRYEMRRESSPVFKGRW